MASDISALGWPRDFGHGVASYEGSPCPNLLAAPRQLRLHCPTTHILVGMPESFGSPRQLRLHCPTTHIPVGMPDGLLLTLPIMRILNAQLSRLKAILFHPRLFLRFIIPKGLHSGPRHAEDDENAHDIQPCH